MTKEFRSFGELYESVQEILYESQINDKLIHTCVLFGMHVLFNSNTSESVYDKNGIPRNGFYIKDDDSLTHQTFEGLLLSREKEDSDSYTFQIRLSKLGYLYLTVKVFNLSGATGAKVYTEFTDEAII